MASQNLFEKYGIKEVADVTFYRIEKKQETYEAQREITVASMLRGAIELQTVYPMEDGESGETGFEAYVFVDAEILKGKEYHEEGSDAEKTHEHSYEEQLCILFSHRQNLITKTGVRYQFDNANEMFGNLVFSDEFATAPHSTNKVVVVGVSGQMTAETYDSTEFANEVKSLTQTLKAKAYNVVYSDYAELVVEDEMGYYNPAFLGSEYKKQEGQLFFFDNDEDESLVDNDTYATWSAGKKGTDFAIKNALMWEDGKHKSINDAIEALRYKQKEIDASLDVSEKGVTDISGGYLVSTEIPNAGSEDIDAAYDNNNEYSYSLDGSVKSVTTNKYPLKQVLTAISELNPKVTGDGILTVTGVKKSNRAIYVNVNTTDTAESAFIYLLHNKNSSRLNADTDGVFEFEDKMGNTLYYQDKIYKGVEYLALVILGTKGLIFVVNRSGKKTVERTAWMINENGYLTDTAAKVVVNNGLIHTTEIVVNDETFEATCTVKDLKVRKTVKNTNRYTPVLFLDTLKVSTLEQTAEEVFAEGGRGNGRLIGWDYGKTITLSLQDALFTPASMSAMFGSYEGNDFRKGVKETKMIDRMEKVTAKRNFIVPAGNTLGTPTEANKTAQTVFYDPETMEPYADGTPIAEGEVFLKYTRSVAYENNSIGKTIEISADKFPGTYKVVGDTFVRSKRSGADERFQIVIPQAKMTAEQTITLEADGEPTVFDMNLEVLRPDDGIMVRFIQYDVVENEEENDGSTMVKDTENLNILDSAELFKVDSALADEDTIIGATEF